MNSEPNFVFFTDEKKLIDVMATATDILVCGLIMKQQHACHRWTQPELPEGVKNFWSWSFF